MIKEAGILLLLVIRGSKATAYKNNYPFGAGNFLLYGYPHFLPPIVMMAVHLNSVIIT
jgi:hypothetical protein